MLKKLFGFNNGFNVYDDEMPRPGSAASFAKTRSGRPPSSSTGPSSGSNKRSADKPFFLWVHVYDPHIPYNPPPEFARKYKGRLYDGEIAYTDQQLGRLFEAVNKVSRRTRR